MVVASEEPEVIRQQMAESRTSLTEKLGFLEDKVTETVQNATSSVTDTVDSVKSAVQDTVDTVKHSVQNTVASVTETFDLPHQVANHPWPMMMGAIGVGYLIGYSLTPSRDQQHRSTGSAGLLTEFGHQAGGAAIPVKSAMSSTASPGFLSSMGETFQTEIAQLKGLAIGTAVGLVRDMLSEAAPSSLKREVGEVIDKVTEKLGGHRISGPVLSSHA